MGLTRVCLICVLGWLWVQESPLAWGNIVLTDVTSETGIAFRHTDGSTGKYLIRETVTAGLALFDYDNDGRIDLYFLNGAPPQGTTSKTPPNTAQRNALYRNLGNWTFEDVTERSGLGDGGYGLGIVVGDYDNDGDADVYLNNDGPNVLYRNNGDGTFTDVTSRAGVGNGHQVGAGACFLDMEGDGDLDLYVANYLAFSEDRHRTSMMGGHITYTNPVHYHPLPDTLYRNNGDGTFTDVSRASGIGAHAGWGMGVVGADYDNDGDTDLFIANDVSANFLFKNDGKGRFEEIGLLSGTAFKHNGDPSASMGVDCGDYDNDGLLDFIVTSYQQELTILYRNLGYDLFENTTRSTGAGTGTLPMVTWGTGFADFDNDAHLDLFFACGHLQVHIDQYDDVTSYLQKNILLRNTGGGKFTDISHQGGSGMRVQLSSRGAAFDDLDNDGDMDCVILNSRAQPTLLRNDTQRSGHWLHLQLKGKETNRDGIGARVTLKAGPLTLVDEVHSGRSYQSHYGTRLHFGLGSQKTIDQIEVRWIGGSTDRYTDIPVDQIVTLEEGEGR